MMMRKLEAEATGLQDNELLAAFEAPGEDADGPRGKAVAADELGVLEPEDEGDVAGLEARHPGVADELAVADEGLDAHVGKDLRQAVEELEAGCRIGVATGGQKPPQKRDTHAPPFHCDHQDVDGGAAKEPVGAVDG